MHHSTERITHTATFVTPVVEHWLEKEIAHCVHHEGSIQWTIESSADALPLSYISLTELLEYSGLMPIASDFQTRATK